MKSSKLISILVFVILLVPFALSIGSIQTQNILPQTVDICGDYAQYSTITVSSIYNKENATLNSVTAKLFINGVSGLNYLTPQEVNIGSINPLSSATTMPQWTIQCNSPVQGVYIAYVNYTSSNGYKASSADEAFAVINVHESMPFLGNITIIEGANPVQSQQNYQIVSDSTPTIKVATTRNSVCKGTLDFDEAYQDMDYLFYGTQKEHTFTFVEPLLEGEHSLYVRCRDEFANIMQSSLIIKFIIDTSSPTITIVSPQSKVVGEFTDLSISVNEDSECRYDKEDDSFSDSTRFETINGTTFTAELTELKEQSYNYYVKCKDKVGNIASREVDFEVELPPKIKITFEKESPWTKGTYELTVIPTKKLRSMPVLKYTFTDDTGFNRDVSLIKEGDTYRGYIIIEDSEKTRAGVFSFLGYDLNGNEGKEITSGGVFLVDTIKPPTPDSLTGVATEEGVSLKWYYDGEKPDHFNVYRSISQGVGYIHLYKSASSQEYSDKSTVKGQLYYYRVAAVDMAGNIGPLSNEVSVYTVSGDAQGAQGTQQVVNSNPPTQQTRDWKKATEKSIDTLLIDLDWAQKNLEEQATKETAVEGLSLVKQVMSAKEDISKLKTQLKGIDVITVSDNDLRETLSKADALIARTKKTIPQSLSVEKIANVVQATTPSDIELGVSEYLSAKENMNYTQNQIKDYTAQLSNLNSKVKVEVEIKTIVITLLDQSTQKKVIVSKKISYESPESLTNVIAVEIIPKTVAGDISSVDIKTPGFEVVKEDPVISWNLPTLSYDKQGISYVLLSSDNSESSKDTKTIILLDPKTSIKEEKSIITGFSIFISKVTSGGIEIIGLIVGILVILGLGFYYFAYINEVDLSVYLKSLPTLSSIAQKKKNEEEEKKSKDQIAAVQKSIPQTKKEATNSIIFENPRPLNTSGFSYLFKSDSPIKTIPGQYFFAKNGDVIRSITELPEVLRSMDDFTFYYHVTDTKNDFAEWVEAIYHNKELADIIQSAKSREELISTIRGLME